MESWWLYTHYELLFKHPHVSISLCKHNRACVRACVCVCVRVCVCVCVCAPLSLGPSLTPQYLD